MSKLTTKARKSLPKSDFGLPAQGKYPMPDKAHAIDAEGRATQQANKGKLTPAQHAAIDAKAHKVLDNTAPVKHTHSRGMK